MTTGETKKVTFRTSARQAADLKVLAARADRSIEGIISEALDTLMSAGRIAEIAATCPQCGEASYAGCEHATITYDKIQSPKEGYERITMEVPVEHVSLLREVAQGMEKDQRLFKYLKRTWKQLWTLTLTPESGDV